MSTTEKDLRDHFSQKLSQLKEYLNGGQVTELKELRQEAIETFNSKGFPTAKDEEYKYTPITKALLKSVKLHDELPTEAGMVPPFGEHLVPGLNGYLLVFWNGKLAFQSDDIPDTVSITALDGLSSDHQHLASYLGKLIKSATDPFATLNTAMLHHGVVVTIDKGVSLDQPLIMYHLSDGSQGTVYTQNRNLILCGENSNASVVEIYKNLSKDHETFHNSASEVYLEQNARLDLSKIQTECSGSILVDNTHINQERNSQVFCNTITTSGNMIRNNLNIAINGEYCESHMNGLYLVNDKSHVDNHTLVDHRIANSYSNELYKGIIDDTATGVFNGKIYVQPNAQKTNAFQSNKNILLSDKASMNTKPQLEIWANDVKCSHGATTGQLDADQVFYLRARGLDEKQAKGLLLYAFATEFLESISLPVLKEYLEKVIADRLYHQQ